MFGPGIFYGCYMAADLEFDPRNSIKRAARQSRSFMVCGFTVKTWAGCLVIVGWGGGHVDQISVISLETRAAPVGGEELWW